MQHDKIQPNTNTKTIQYIQMQIQIQMQMQYHQKQKISQQLFKYFPSDQSLIKNDKILHSLFLIRNKDRLL